MDAPGRRRGRRQADEDRRAERTQVGQGCDVVVVSGVGRLGRKRAVLAVLMVIQPRTATELAVFS